MALSSGSGECRMLYLCHRVSGALLGYSQGHSRGLPVVWCECGEIVRWVSRGHRLGVENGRRGEMYPAIWGLIVGAGCGWT